MQSSISEKRDDFQQLVLDVLQRAVVPELRAVSGGKMDSNFKQLITETVRFLRGNLSWLTSLSAKQRFCWGILSTCCSKIAIANDHFEWVHHYSTIFVDLQLGLVYTTYCTGKKLSNEDRIITSQLPKDIQTNPSEDMHRGVLGGGGGGGAGGGEGC